jgi:propanol-preferring alcohol dehydrogenase
MAIVHADKATEAMRAMVFEGVGKPLRLFERPVQEPAPGHVSVKVLACAVCRTDLHLIDGELPDPELPVIPGHEIVGEVLRTGAGVDNLKVGQRVGIPWLGYTCGTCRFCRSGRENLCDQAKFTGYQLDGGYATHTLADARYCFVLPGGYSAAEAAPLLCAGLIGHRCLKAAGDAKRLGIYGFGAAAHIIAQVAIAEGREVYALTRPGDEAAQDFARSLGCTWAGGSDGPPPQELDASIIFAPVGPLVPQALKAVSKGGTVVMGGIHMSDVPAMPYRLLWGERVLRSVANLTREDASEFLATAGRQAIDTSITVMPLAAANEALERLRGGEVSGAIVLSPDL